MYLPRKGVSEYSKGQTIFDESNPSRSLHLVVQGRVKFAAPLDNGAQTVVDIFTTDDFFGESALLGSARRIERATALDKVTLMSWDSTEIEEQVQRQPRLGIALMQMLVKRTLDYEERIQSFALDKTPERIAGSLLRFASRLGTQNDDGWVRIPPLTHQLISEYISARNRHIPVESPPAEGLFALFPAGHSGCHGYPPPLSEKPGLDSHRLATSLNPSNGRSASLYLHRALRLEDLRVPPGSQLELLKGDRAGSTPLRRRGGEK